MADIIDFKSAQKRHKMQRKKRALCQNGHHSWVVSKTHPFENKQGKLVTVSYCKHCGKEKTVTK